MEGIEKVSFDPDQDVFVIEYRGTPAQVEAMKEAIEKAVVGKALRRALARPKDE